MKRLGLLVAVGAAILLGSALPALAQFGLGDTPGARTPAYNVSFNGQLRFIGVAWNNLNDFTDTQKVATNCGTGTFCKDSNSRYFERLRWWLTIESADKKAKIVWNAQVGDLTLGNGSGVADELGSTPASQGGRVGPNGGGAAGGRGVNMQQRQIYIAFEPWIESTRVTLGIQYLAFLDGPASEFFADNEPGVRFDWLGKPVDFSLWMAKLSENDLNNADDNEFYAARVGINVTPDIRVTAEGLVGNWQCFQRRPLPAGATGGANTTLANKGTCVKADFGDARWFGGTVNAKLAGMTLYGGVVYGERPIYSNALDKVFKERGYGVMFTAVVPVGPLGVTAHTWYTSGDKDRFVGGAGGGSCATKVSGPTGDCHGVGNTTKINRNSDKLPVPESGSSWLSVPYIADFLTGNATIGGPTGLGQPLNADISGTWGVGGAVSWALTPAFNLNLGVGFVGASETKNSAGGKNAIFGDSVVEFDFGPRWTINANLSMQGVVGYLVPEKGDDAWGAAYRFIYFF